MADSGAVKGIDPDRWHRIDDLLSAALEHEAGQRASFLARECGGDEELKSQVESLLRDHEELGSFLEHTAIKTPPADNTGTVPGPRIGSYRLLRRIGQGGMGTVYLAERADGEFRQRVALKIIKRGMDTDAILGRFRRERQILASLQHPNIAMLLDGGTSDDGLPYFAMEYIEGQGLLDYADSRRLPVRERLKLFQTICSAVHYAHQNQVVHRDLKPGNILVNAQGIPKLVDFGIAKVLDPDFGSGIFEGTVMGVRPMTPEYASPEQVLGKPIGAPSDIYSLGVLLYELLSGRRPSPNRRQIEARFLSQTPPLSPSVAVSQAEWTVSPDQPSAQIARTVAQISLNRSTTPTELRRQLTGDLDTIVLKAMHFEPERRYASTQELSDDLQRHLTGLPILARKDAGLYRLSRYVRRRKAVVVLGAFAISIAIWAAKVRPFFQGSTSERERGSRVLAAVAPGLPSKSSRPDLPRVRQLTATRSCPFAPIFLDSETVAYDIRYGAQWGLFSLNLRRGLTKPLLLNQLAYAISPGRSPTEALYSFRETGPDGEEGQPKLGTLDLLTGSKSSLEVPPPAALARGAIYYARPGGSELRRFAGDLDESVVSISAQEEIILITASPDQSRLALMVGTSRFARVCLIDLTSSAKTETVLNCPMSQTFGRVGRISFSPDSKAIYYASAAAIRRFEIASKSDEELVPEVFARGGVTISPDGSSLVYSDCRPRGPIWDVSASPPRIMFDDELAGEPAGGPDGLLAYVRDRGGRRTVVVRDRAGLTREVSARVLGRAGTPSIDASGNWVAFAEEGSRPGIYIADTNGRDLPKPITSGGSDYSPVWTRDGRIVFNRWVEPHIPYVYVVDRNTGEARQAHPKARRVLDSRPETGLILLSSQDKTRLYLWDIATGVEKPVSLGDLGTPYVMAAALSQLGDFLAVQTGLAGRTVWKVPLTSATKNPEKVFSAEGDPSMSNVAVLSDGRILVGVRHWLGELYLVPARAGEVF